MNHYIPDHRGNFGYHYRCLDCLFYDSCPDHTVCRFYSPINEFAPGNPSDEEREYYRDFPEFLSAWYEYVLDYEDECYLFDDSETFFK